MSGKINSAGSKSGVIGETELPLPIATKHRVNVDRPGDGPYTSDEYTTLLIHSDTTHGSTTFTDSSSVGATITNVSASHDTTHSKIGASSIYFAEGDSINVPDAAGLSFGRKAFTIDFWSKYVVDGGSTPSIRIIGQGGNNNTEAAGQWFIRSYVNGVNACYLPFRTTNVGQAQGWSAVDMNDGKWHHTCLTKGDNEDSTAILQMAVDGVFVGGFGVLTTTGGRTVTQDHEWRNLNETTNSAPLHIGGAPFPSTPENWEGWIDEIRFSKGIQRWKANFTVG